MLKRLKMGAAAALGLTALALGGSAVAAASSSTTDPQTPGPDIGNVQAGGNVQDGNQSAPDTGTASTAESDATSSVDVPGSGASENASVGDGPGGHADPPGVDVQQQGQN